MINRKTGLTRFLYYIWIVPTTDDDVIGIQMADVIFAVAYLNLTMTRIVLLSFVASIILAVDKAAALSDPGKNPSTATSYIYSQSFDASSEAAIEEEEHGASFISSSLLYDEGCSVSSQAMIFNGDDSFQGDLARYYEDLEGDDEDDDDDDDDGHSSMLSNVSLRRSRVYVSRRPVISFKSRGGTKSDHSLASKSPAFVSDSLSSFLKIRGGAAAAAAEAATTAATGTGNELMKKLFVTALVTLIFEGSVGHVLEFIKIVMQTSQKTYYQTIQDITSEKGVFGLWDGFIPWGVVQAIFKGSVFGLAYAVASGYLMPLADRGVIPRKMAVTIAGGIGGGFQGYVLSPTLLLKTRVMTNEVFREKMSLLRTTWLSLCIGADVVKNEGIMTLMKGSNIFATKRVFDWSTRFLFADMFETLFLRIGGATSLSFAEKSAASFLGGIASTILTLPLDVLVAQTQDAKKAGIKVSPVKMFQNDLKEKGWGGLKDAYLRGFEARLLHVCLTVVAIKTGTPIVYDAIFGNQS